MNRRITLALTAVALLVFPTGCSGSDDPDDRPGPATTPTGVAIAPIDGGAAVKLGDVEEAISQVGCLPFDDTWTVSGSNEGGAKAAVTTTKDRQTVITASVALADGKLVDVRPDQGNATIVWDGEAFLVTGVGPYIDLTASAEPSGEVGFLIKGSCPAS